MTSQFSVVSRTDLGATRWDALCAESHAAWLFHTSCWLPMLKIEDVSFAVVDRDGKPLSLVGVGSPENSTGTELWLSNLRAGIAHMDGLPVDLQHELDRFALSEVQRIATSKGALWVDWELPSMPPGPEALVSALRTSGYQCDIWPSKVVDLTLDEDGLWRDYRKGCRSVIRRAQRLGVTVQSITDESVLLSFPIYTRGACAPLAHRRRPRMYSWRCGSCLRPQAAVRFCWRACRRVYRSRESCCSVTRIWCTTMRLAPIQTIWSPGGTRSWCMKLSSALSQGVRRYFIWDPSPLASQVAEKAYLVGRFKNQFGGQQKAWVMSSLVLRTQPSPALRTHLSAREMVSTILPPGVKRRLRNLRPS